MSSLVARSTGHAPRWTRSGPATLFSVLCAVALGFVGQVRADGSLLTLPNTKTIFAFGDSYTATGFDPSQGYDPLSQNLSTSSGGGTWVSYLSTSPLASPSLAENTFALARGGATVSPEATFAGYPNMSLANQVDWFEREFTDSSVEFVEKQQERGGAPSWEGESTLFTIWFGINDLELAFKRGEDWQETYGNSTFVELDRQVERLYNLGARHFLFHLIPPYWQTPLVSKLWANDAKANATFRADVPLWNDLLRQYGGRVHEIYQGASAMVWETEEWFEVVLSAPALFGFANSTDYCDAYVSHIWEPNADPTVSDPSCGPSEGEYVWLDRSHPTWRLHEWLASAVATTLSPGEGFVAPPPLITADQAAAIDAPAAEQAEEGVLADSTDADFTSDDGIVSAADDAAPAVVATAAAVDPAAVDPSVPSPISTPVDPNEGAGYSTLPNGDTVPTGVVWTRRQKKRADSGSASLAAPVRKRPDWKTRSSTSRAAAPTPAVPSSSIPVNVPADVNAGVGYVTLANGDTLPTGTVWTKKRRALDEQEDEGVEEGEQQGDEDAEEYDDGEAYYVEIGVLEEEGEAYESADISLDGAGEDLDDTADFDTAVDPSVPSPVSVPIDPNEGAGYSTLPNGDTLPTGTTWTRHKKRADVVPPPAPAAASGNSSSSLSFRQKRPQWKTRPVRPAGLSTSTSPATPASASASDPSTSPAPTPALPSLAVPAPVPLDPNAGAGFVTLANGDTLPTGTVWTRHKKRGGVLAPGYGHGPAMRKIEPTMVHEQEGDEAEETKRVGRRDGFWREVKDRAKDSVVRPIGAV
ncbi:hypothetical protein JCM10207_006809 [Rhodosporidiobolus poonsookiae]